MKFLTAICVAAVLVCVGPAQAQEPPLTVVEDFEAYDVDASIHEQGWDETWLGPRWYSQANVSEIPTDSNRAFVREEGGNQCLHITGQNHNNDDNDYNATAMSMWDYEIAGEGTIYFCFRSNGDPNDIALQTNDLYPGWDYDGVAQDDPGTVGASGFQGNLGTQCWTWTGIITHFCGAANGAGWFRGRDGAQSGTPYASAGEPGYKDVQVDANYANEWTELWIHVDHENDRCKFFIADAGEDPAAIMNPDGGDWWSMRNEDRDNDAVLNLRFQVGSAWTYDEMGEVWLDNIAVNTTEWSLARPDVPLPPEDEPGTPGDLDGDGDVDLDDFAILKLSFGIDDGGDCDGDGDTDLDDFSILKQNFGT